MNDWVQSKIFISNSLTGGIKYGSIYNFEKLVRIEPRIWHLDIYFLEVLNVYIEAQH